MWWIPLFISFVFLGSALAISRYLGSGNPDGVVKIILWIFAVILTSVNWIIYAFI